MFSFNHHSTGNPAEVIATLDRYVEAGIDPAFDHEMDELERQFAEYRLTLNHD